jgi:branched-chain amino acid transport system permease protein
MNTRASGAASPATQRTAPEVPAVSGVYAQAPDPALLRFMRRHFSVRHVIGVALLLMLPFVATPFITFQVAAQSLALGLIALSLTFLGGYGGMVSLAQMTVAGIAGYATAILCTSSGAASASLGWPWWIGLPAAVLVSVLCATLIGWLSVRTEGIYTIMITLAIGVAFYYLVLQNYSLFNGFQGLREVYPPKVLDIAWREPLPFYMLCLACAIAGYALVRHVVRAPFGIALQGIRDNPRRMAALGFNVVAHRVAAYALAGLLAAVGGVLLVWYNGLITPGSVGMSWLINILVIAVLGGMKRPLGAFAGALVFVLLQTFAIDMLGGGARERFNLIIGGVFLAIVLFSPDGLLGLWAMFRSRFARKAKLHHPRRQA